MEQLVTIKTFIYPHEAYVIRGKLESEGIQIFLKDDMTVQMHNFYSNSSKEWKIKNFLLIAFVLLGIMLFTPSLIKAQDLLVTIKYDSLNCKVGKLQGDYYPIEFMLDDQLMSGKIHRDTVMFYRKNMFRGIDDYRLRPWYPTVSLGLNVGAGHQFGPLRVGLADDFQPLKGSSSDRNTFYTGADLAIFVSSKIGYGIKYHHRRMLGGDIKENYIGPMMVIRSWDKNRKNHWFMHFSAGYGRIVHDNATIKIGTRTPEPIKLTAGTLAGDISVGYNFKLSRHVSTLLKLSTVIGYPNFVRIFDYARINPGGANPAPDISGYCHNMNSVNLSVGFEFH